MKEEISLTIVQTLVSQRKERKKRQTVGKKISDPEIGGSGALGGKWVTLVAKKVHV